MRIIGGKYGGRNLQVAKGLPVRPTTDRTKEALFNILEHRVDWAETRVLDLFCGTGNISLECVSRGAASVLSVDRHRKCILSIKNNMKTLGREEPQLICADVKKFLKSCDQNFDLIFMDPPYAMPGQEALIETIFEKNILAPDGMLILEHSSTLNFSSLNKFVELRKYGSSHLSFFE